MHIIYDLEKTAAVLGVTVDKLKEAIDKPKRKNWSPEEDELLMQSREAWVAFKELARVLGRSESATRSRYYIVKKKIAV